MAREHNCWTYTVAAVLVLATLSISCASGQEADSVESSGRSDSAEPSGEESPGAQTSSVEEETEGGDSGEADASDEEVDEAAIDTSALGQVADGATGAKLVAALGELECSSDEAQTVKVGPTWREGQKFKVQSYDGPGESDAVTFDVEVLSEGFSASLLKWESQGDSDSGGTQDVLPTIEYFVQPGGEINGLANPEEVRDQAIAINADLSEEVSDEAAEQAESLIRDLPEETLLALYASRPTLFHSLDGIELNIGQDMVEQTVVGDASGLGIELPARVITRVDEPSNENGCVVVTQSVSVPEEVLEAVAEQSTVGVDDLATRTLTLLAWVDSETGEVRRIRREETLTQAGAATVVSTNDLLTTGLSG